MQESETQLCCMQGTLNCVAFTCEAAQRVTQTVREPRAACGRVCLRYILCARSRAYHTSRNGRVIGVSTADQVLQVYTSANLSSAFPTVTAIVLRRNQDVSRPGQGRSHGGVAEQPWGHRPQPVQQANDGSAQKQAAVSGCAAEACCSSETRHYSCCRKPRALRGGSVRQLLLTKVQCYQDQPWALW